MDEEKKDNVKIVNPVEIRQKLLKAYKAVKPLDDEKLEKHLQFKILETCQRNCPKCVGNKSCIDEFIIQHNDQCYVLNECVSCILLEHGMLLKDFLNAL